MATHDIGVTTKFNTRVPLDLHLLPISSIQTPSGSFANASVNPLSSHGSIAEVAPPDNNIAFLNILTPKGQVI